MTADKPSHEYSIMGHDLKRKLVIRIGIKFEPYTHFIERTLILNFVIFLRYPKQEYFNIYKNNCLITGYRKILCRAQSGSYAPAQNNNPIMVLGKCRLRAA